MNRTYILTSQRVLLSGKLQPAGILVEDGKIGDVSSEYLHRADSQSTPIINYGDAVIMPGLIDPHVHINEPGRTDWEGFETATLAAAAGGITLLADMPLNSSPVTTSAEALRTKRMAAEGKSRVDVVYYGGLIPGNENRIGELLDAGVSGIKAFLSPSGLDEFPNCTEKELRRVMPLLASRGVPLLVHAEHPDDTTDTHPVTYTEYERSRPPRWEIRAIALLIRLCRETRCPVHIVHLSAADALPMLRQARNEGLPITVETAPHYLYFAAEEIPISDPRFKCAPPIRDARNRDALWNGLRSGDIDFVATDHSPCPPELKSGSLTEAWGGISSLQLMLPAVWTAGRKCGATIADIAGWTSNSAARFLGMSSHQGAIAPGQDASLVVWHPEKKFTVDATKLYHRHPVTPYDGDVLSGVVEATWLRGKQVFSSQKGPL